MPTVVLRLQDSGDSHPQNKASLGLNLLGFVCPMSQAPSLIRERIGDTRL